MGSDLLSVVELLAPYGSQTCAALRADVRSFELVARICGLSHERLDVELGRASGDTPVSEALARSWPTPSDCTVEALHGRNVGSCRSELLAVLIVATEYDVSRKLVENELGRWTARAPIEAFLKDFQFHPKVVARWPVARVRDDDQAIAVVARSAHLDEDTVLGVVSSADPELRIGRLFELGGGARTEPKSTVGQGGHEHRTLQEAILRAGKSQRYDCYSERSYPVRKSRRRPDVSWHRSTLHRQPTWVFEIELGGTATICKSWLNLEAFFHEFNCRVILVTWEAQLDLARSNEPWSLRLEPTTTFLLTVEELLAAYRIHGVDAVVELLRQLFRG